MKKLLITLAAAIGLAATTFAATLNLSTVTADTTIPNGTTLTGTLNSNVKLTIASRATVTLSGVTINGVDNSSYKWAGLTCTDNATIILASGTSSTVKGFHSYYPGIYVKQGYTLTIQGSGSLTARSNGYGAGIGGGSQIDCGNIVIEGGTITAYGGSDGAAGIGSGYDSTCGNITISGGDVTTYPGNAGAGIGCGSQGACGNITVSGGTIYAGGTTVGDGSSVGIGSGNGGICGSVVISGGDVEAYGVGSCVGIGCGSKGACGGVFVWGGSVYAESGRSGVAPIGASESSGSCGPIIVGDDMDDQTSGEERTIVSKVVNLAAVTENTTVADGKILTGTLGGNYKVSIADGATVTLRDATINGVKNASYKWAGLTCNGNATIILEGSNTVKGFYEYYPGIYVPEGSTLTIKGDGSLAARSNGYGAGIGGSYNLSCGNIRIEGGTITATGGTAAAGIGGANSVACGYITITGGTIEAMGGARAAGIGSGSGNAASCGDITITKGVSIVTATKGNSNSYSVGAGYAGTCGTVTIGGVVTGNITQSPYTYYGKPIDLSELSADITVPNGTVITGTLGGNYKVSIADGATVTLRDVTINGESDDNYGWAGITCVGNATIILEGANTVKGFYEDYPGIHVPANKTLTIKGDGSLDASSNGYGAGIGGGWEISCGNIVIEGGSITANGGELSAGIGSGGDSSGCGNITITGGIVEATGGNYAAGIGSGDQGSCGDITITKGVTSVTATKGDSAPNSIGAGNDGTCGTVTIGDSVIAGNISKSPYTYHGQVVDLSGLSGAYTAQDGDTLKGTTAYAVTIPAGATVTVNGVSITGAAGGTVLPSPAFSAGGKAATTEFTQGANGKWTLTTFAELANDALGKDVADGQVKVYRADTVAGLDSASPMSSGVEVKGKKSAVMTTIEVTPPTGAQSQFFKVTFGE